MTSDESESEDELVQVTNQPVVQNQREVERSDLVESTRDSVSSTNSADDEPQEVASHIEDEINDEFLLDEHQPEPVQPEPVQPNPYADNSDVQRKRYPRRVRIPPVRYNPVRLQSLHQQPQLWYPTVQYHPNAPSWYP